MKNVKRSCFIALLAIMTNLQAAHAQEKLILPDASPAAMVMQEVGISHVTIRIQLHPRQTMIATQQ